MSDPIVCTPKSLPREKWVDAARKAVEINPATPSEVFAGGGDPNYHGGWRSGLGIWRSMSNGDPGSWAKVSPIELDNHVIYRLRIDPAAPGFAQLA